MTAASAQFRTLVGLTSSELGACMRHGQTPDAANLEGAEFRGANTAGWTRPLRVRQFIKGFERQPDGRLLGYNRRVHQDGLDGNWGSPSDRFAFFEVRDADPASRDSRYPQALMLDYGACASSPLNPVGRIRDYVVRVESGSDALLLGRAFLALGPLRPSPTYFVLERLR